MNRPAWFAVALVVTASAWGAFERPSENDRRRALGNLFEEPEALRPLLTPNEDFPPITPPGPKDWLTLYEEKGQTFEEYRDFSANRPDTTRHIIYLLPIGEFPEETSPPLAEIRAYAATFFQMEVKVLPAYMAHDLEFDPRKNPRSGQRQVLTRSIMAFLKTQLPADGFCLLGVTMTDLYPQPSWNYVFGEASLDERVGVYSFARYDPTFWNDERAKDYQNLILQRSCKVLVHETAHMFGLLHCIYYDCVVNGANHMVETDAQPQHLCPVCLRKLHHSIGFEPIKRYEELASFYRRRRWYEEADFVGRQLKRVGQPKAAGDSK